MNAENPQLTPSNATSAAAPSMKIIEPQPPLPDYSLDQFPADIRAMIAKHNWKDLMLVQKKAIPYLLNAQDIIVQSKTGSGKTGAFVLPLLQIIEKSHVAPQALIMVPTRELAVQVYEETLRLCEPLGIKAVSIFGGVSYGPQLEALKNGVHIVVGTPGRLLDHILNGHFKLDSIRDLVLDEADELLSMGFYPDMKRIHGLLPKDRCTYLFSATIPVNVKRLALEFMRQPKFLSLCPTEISVSNMEHEYYVVDLADKDKTLFQLIEWTNPESAIIFCNTRKDTSYVYEFLRARGLKLGIISGEIEQKNRQKVMKELKNGEIRFLVATDVAARGIDIQGLTHVFMYDHPADPEIYVHRSGRTARAGNSGLAISIVGHVEEISLRNTANQFGIPFVKKSLPSEASITALISERTTVYLEQEYRQIKQPERQGAERMLPLLNALINSEDEKKVLGMILNKFYWEKFTGLKADEIVPKLAQESEA